MSMPDISQPLREQTMAVENRENFTRAREQGSQLSELTTRVERLTLACQALWEILQERQGLSDSELKAKMLEIDARDGALDGAIAQEAVNCPACGHLTVTKRSQCQFCGEAVERRHIFRA